MPTVEHEGLLIESKYWTSLEIYEQTPSSVTSQCLSALSLCRPTLRSKRKSVFWLVVGFLKSPFQFVISFRSVSARLGSARLGMG